MEEIQEDPKMKVVGGNAVDFSADNLDPNNFLG